MDRGDLANAANGWLLYHGRPSPACHFHLERKGRQSRRLSSPQSGDSLVNLLVLGFICISVLLLTSNEF